VGGGDDGANKGGGEEEQQGEGGGGGGGCEAIVGVEIIGPPIMAVVAYWMIDRVSSIYL